MKCISLKNGILFRTAQNYTWISSSRTGMRMCSIKQHQDAEDEELPVDGEILIPGIQGWTSVKNFKCDPGDIQATWKD